MTASQMLREASTRMPGGPIRLASSFDTHHAQNAGGRLLPTANQYEYLRARKHLGGFNRCLLVQYFA